ncbi:MAG TPA: pantoate--beta-alanine ligase [Polyangia bacterium]|nr:pantoate--beta-alanine ligase [Polyangia bacterium]
MTAPGPRVINRPAEMSAWSDAARARGERIAFVPTMGYLHAGHVALLEEARRRGDRVVLSIFVNPTQFGPNEDLARYPRDLPGDLAKATAAGTDVAFVPEPVDMYPPGHQTTVQVHELEQGLCGATRPGHFVGVATVVCKLFNIVRPHVSVFGEKDFQQLAVIRRMVRDLDMPVEVVGLPTVREPDGLAMSSRNKFLSPDERQRAVVLSRALFAARASWQSGQRDVAALIAAARATITPQVTRLQYLELRDAHTLQTISTIDRPAVMAVAAFMGQTRLIDNLRLG